MDSPIKTSNRPYEHDAHALIKTSTNKYNLLPFRARCSCKSSGQDAVKDSPIKQIIAPTSCDGRSHQNK